MHKSEQGASNLSFLFFLAALVLLVKAAFVLWPVYWDDRTINTQIQEQLKNYSEADRNVQAFNAAMDQRLQQNNIRDLHFKDIAHVSIQQGVRVQKKYEVRRPYLFNIDFVLTFEKNFDQSSVQAK